MKLHYVSDHAILEYEEVSLFVELGIDVFSNGAYSNPHGHYLLPRPGIPAAPYYPEYERLSRETARTELPDELIEPFDVLYFAHAPQVLIANWQRIRKKRVIWRSIGQSNQALERMLQPLRNDGLRVVRYSPKERQITDFMGSDEVIRFYKDPGEFKDWNGKVRQVINLTQTLKGRGKHCHYEHLVYILGGFPAKVYGPGNEDLGGLNGGSLPYEFIKQQLRDSRAFVYGGTWPAAYTLAFIEAWMTGIPVVSIGKKLAEEIPGLAPMDFFEIPELIEHGVSGFMSSDLDELRAYVFELLDNYELAEKVGRKGRERAVEVFGKDLIKKQWDKFFKNL